jgi:hypothetical protein
MFFTAILTRNPTASVRRRDACAVIVSSDQRSVNGPSRQAICAVGFPGVLRQRDGSAGYSGGAAAGQAGRNARKREGLATTRMLGRVRSSSSGSRTPSRRLFGDGYITGAAAATRSTVGPGGSVGADVGLHNAHSCRFNLGSSLLLTTDSCPSRHAEPGEMSRSGGNMGSPAVGLR